MRLGSADRVLADYPVALLVMANFACARAAAFGWVARLARPARWLADRSFTLYLSHGIVIGLWRVLVPFERGSVQTVVGLGLAIGVVTVGLYPLTEALRTGMRTALGMRRGLVRA
jgi:peptidoglycan/LPS O-acetylase OafA/YrhL